MIDRFPTKMNSLNHIKAFLNDEIATVIDVGILISTKELMSVFSEKKHVLIEPLQEYYEVINERYSQAGIDFTLLELAASNNMGVQNLQKRNHLPNLGDRFGGVTASNLVFTEGAAHDPTNIVSVKTDTLDNIKSAFTGPFLVKIDVDGAEFEILEGLRDVDDVYLVVVECWLSRIERFQSVMKEKGFNLYDITDLCYMRGQLSQVDLVFLNRKLFDNEAYPEISPRRFGHTPAVSGNYVPFNENVAEKNIDRFQAISERGQLE
ncbi:MAG: FkbM family methyltransferase [Pseudomonadota bacterium]